MKILQILPGKIWGGAEQVALDLAKGLRTRGHDVVIVARPSEPVMRRLALETFEIRKIEGKQLPLQGADVVHAHSFRLGKQAAQQIKDTTTRVVATRHDARSSAMWPWERKAMKQIDALIFVSQLGRSLWTAKNKWMPPPKLHTIPNRIPQQPTPHSPLSTLHPDDLRHRFSIPPHSPLILFAGRLRATKGCGVIIEALGLLKERDWHLVMAGAPKPKGYDRRLMARADMLGIANRVHMLGFTHNARSLMPQADMLLAPSTFIENWPLVPMEAMKAGVPVIVTDNGGQREYIENGRTGLLVPPDDPQRLSVAIASLLDHPDNRRAMGNAAAHAIATRWQYEGYLDHILSLYQQ